MSSATPLPFDVTTLRLVHVMTDVNRSLSWNSSGGDNGTTTEPTVSEGTVDQYTLYQVIYYMANYYLWVLLALGVPGNIASIFTIVTMPTVSSSKVNIPLYGPTNGVVTNFSHRKTQRNRKSDLANCIEDNDLRQLLSTNENALHRHNHTNASCIPAPSLAVN